jgi:hypothetical protein
LKNGNLVSVDDEGFLKIWYSLNRYNSSTFKKPLRRKNKPASKELVATINIPFGILRLLLMKDQKHVAVAGASSIISLECC